MLNMSHTVVKPAFQNTYKHCRSRKCIRGHIPMYKIFAVFNYFSYLSYPGHPSCLGLQTKTRRQGNSSTFFSFKSYNPETSMSSTGEHFCACCSQALTKSALHKKWAFWLIPMIQPPFCSSCVALQYEPGSDFLTN